MSKITKLVKIAAAASLMALASHSISKADSHGVAAYSHTGLSIGAGINWSKQDGATAISPTGPLVPKTPIVPAAACNIAAIALLVCDPTNVVASGADETFISGTASLLAMYQVRRFVIGVEIGGEFGGEAQGAFTHVRLGYAFGRLLPYIHGGAGFEKADQPAGAFRIDDQRITGRVGGGMQWAFTDSWSLDARYTYVAGGDLRDRLANGGAIEAGDSRHVGTVGLFMKF